MSSAQTSAQSSKRFLSPDGDTSETPKRIHAASGESELDQTISYDVHGQEWIQKTIKETLENILPVLFENALKKVNSEIQGLLQENSELRGVIQKLQDKVERLEKRSDDHEQESRLSSVVLINEWPESKTESTLNMARNYIQEALQLDVHDNDIIKCHRIGKRREDGRAPRPILIKFSSVSMKTEVLAARRRTRQFTSSSFPRPVYINEDLTEPRRSMLAKCRILKKNKQITDCWTQAGRVYIKLISNQVKLVDDKVLNEI